MKKSLFYYVLAMLCMVSLFTSCSNDEDAAVSAANEVVGEYSGKLNVFIVSSDGKNVPSGTIDSQAITVTKAGDNAINLSITNFTFNNIPLGNIELKDCALTANGDKYDFTGTTNLNNQILTADVAATGSFSNGTLTLDLDIDAVLGGVMNQTVKVTYSGTKQK